MYFLPFVISISDPLWDLVKGGVYEYVWPVAIILTLILLTWRIG